MGRSKRCRASGRSERGLMLLEVKIKAFGLKLEVEDGWRGAVRNTVIG